MKTRLKGLAAGVLTGVLVLGGVTAASAIDVSFTDDDGTYTFSFSLSGTTLTVSSLSNDVTVRFNEVNVVVDVDDDDEEQKTLFRGSPEFGQSTNVVLTEDPCVLLAQGYTVLLAFVDYDSAGLSERPASIPGGVELDLADLCNPSGGGSGAPLVLGIGLNLDTLEGAIATNKPISITGHKQKALSPYTLTLEGDGNESVTLVHALVSLGGNFSGHPRLGGDVSPGSYRLVLVSHDVDGKQYKLVQAFTVLEDGRIGTIGTPVGSITTG